MSPAQHVEGARTSLDAPILDYVEREEWIVRRCARKSVLHLGCLGETEGSRLQRVEGFLASTSLHQRLVGVASRVVGIDINQEVIETLRAQAEADVVLGDVERLDQLDVGGRFDTCIAGDLIEHLSNPGRFLESAKSVIKEGGELIITTPNALGLPNYLRFARDSFKEGGDHVHSHNQFTLEHLLNRHGWRVSERYTCHQARAFSKMNRLTFKLGHSALSAKPRFGGTLLFVAQVG